MDPRYVLLDEPFAGVDPISVGEIRSIVATLKARGIGVLITDHNVGKPQRSATGPPSLPRDAPSPEGTPESILSNQQVRDVYLGDQFAL